MARHQNVSYRARAWNDDNLDGLKRWAEAVEPEDCRLLGQIQDPGRGRHNSGIGAYAIGASALPDDLSWTVPHALTLDEIHSMTDDFAASSARLERCGFSGVEISCGHGHLFHQFLSPWSNARADDYGGDWKGRTRFVRELVKAIRASCGREFLIGLKLPGNDWVPGGIGPTEAAIVTSALTASREVDWWPAPAAKKRRVVVIGTGVAGLEAAWVAAARGHTVTTFGRSSEIGGKTRLHALLPGGATLANIYDYQLDAARKAGVRFELGVEASAAGVIALAPHAVILAAGSRMLRPPRMPQEVRCVPDLRSAMRDVLNGPERRAGAAVIFDMDHTEGTYAAAELLRRTYDRVVVMTPLEYIAQKTALVTRQGIIRRFHEKRIEVVPLAQPIWTAAPREKLEYANVYSGVVNAIQDVAFVAYSTPRVPQNALAGPLRAAGIEVRLVGDCALARGVLAATAEGHAAGNAL